MSEGVAVDPKEATFLIVDDDGQVRDILTQYLNSFGFDKVVQAKDGREAIKIVQDHDQRIDFIISDWEMPHIDGLTLLKAVRKDPIRTNVKFLMVSSQGSHERMKISKAAKSRVDAYIVKPFRANILKDKINILMNGGIDESAAEFEKILNLEVPANKPVSRSGGVMKLAGPKQATSGKIIQVGNETQGPTGKVTRKDVDTSTPDSYDLSEMNSMEVLSLVKNYMQNKNFDKVIKLCTDAIAMFPDNADLCFYAGQAHYSKGEYKIAAKFLKYAVKLQPYHVGAHSLLNEINVLLQKSG